MRVLFRDQELGNRRRVTRPWLEKVDDGFRPIAVTDADGAEATSTVGNVGEASRLAPRWSRIFFWTATSGALVGSSAMIS